MGGEDIIQIGDEVIIDGEWDDPADVLDIRLNGEGKVIEYQIAYHDDADSEWVPANLVELA